MNEFTIAAPPEVPAELKQAMERGEGVKADGDKDRWELLPVAPTREVVRVLTVGARKYRDDNWRKVPDARRRYYGAALRHLTAWADGETNDPETGLPHLAHAMCCLLFIRGVEIDVQRGEP